MPRSARRAEPGSGQWRGCRTSPVQPIAAGVISRDRERPRSQATWSGRARPGRPRRRPRGSAAPGRCRASRPRAARTGRTCRACRGRPARAACRRPSVKPIVEHSSAEPKPASASELLTACRSVTSPETSPSVRVTVSQWKPKRSVLRVTLAPAFVVMSFSASAITASSASPSTSRKHTDPEPVVVNPSVCSDRAACGTANSTSRSACGGLVRPRMESKMPTRVSPARKARR